MGNEATNAGNLSGHFRQISAIPSLAIRAKAGESPGSPIISGEGTERVMICRTSGQLSSIRARASMSQSMRRSSHA